MKEELTCPLRRENRNGRMMRPRKPRNDAEFRTAKKPERVREEKVILHSKTSEDRGLTDLSAAHNQVSSFEGNEEAFVNLVRDNNWIQQNNLVLFSAILTKLMSYRYHQQDRFVEGSSKHSLCKESQDLLKDLYKKINKLIGFAPQILSETDKERQYSNKTMINLLYGTTVLDKKTSMDFIQKFTRLFPQLNEFEGLDFALCFHALNRQDPSLIKSLIKNTADRFKEFRGVLSIKEFIMSLQSSERLHSKEEKKIMNLLLTKLDKAELKSLNLVNISKLLNFVRIRNLDPDQQIEILGLLPLNSIADDSESLQGINLLTKQVLFRELNLLAFKKPHLKRFLDPILPKLEYLNRNNHPRKGSKAASEEIASGVIKQHFGNQEVIQSEYLDGIEMDFYIPKLKLNIEIDGISHKDEFRTLQDQDRDEYLKQKRGLDVMRIDITGVNDNHKDQYTNFVQNRVVESLRAYRNN